MDIQVSRLAVVVVVILTDISMEVESSLGLFLWSGISKSKILAMNFFFFFNLREPIKYRSLINGLEAGGSYRTM